MESDAGGGEGSCDPRVYFAAERTLLSYVRTGLALMGFGFIVARFGLFLREIAAVHAMPPPTQPAFSLWAGTALIILGVAVNLFAAIKDWHTVRRLKNGQPIDFPALSLAAILALLLVLVGTLMAVYLLFGL